MLRTITFITYFLLCFVSQVHAQLELSANQEYGQIFDITYDNAQEGTLYARTVGNHIVKSEDDGQNWEILYSDPMEQYCTLSGMRLINNGEHLSVIVKAQGTSYNKVILINPENGTVEHTYNSPNSDETDILIASYDIYEANNDIAIMHTTFTLGFDYTNEVFITNDGGATWQSIYYDPDYNNVSIENIAISPTNPDRIFLMRGFSSSSEMGGLFLSQDAGTTWEEKIPGNTYNAIAFNPNNADDILLGTFYGYGDHQENLYRSSDAGETWNIVPITWTSMSTDHINSIAFDPSNPNNIIVLEENEIAISNDNGVTWQNEVYDEIDPEEYYYGLSVSFSPFVRDEVIIGTDFYPFRSTDGGVTLEKIENRLVNSTGRIDSYFSASENHLYYGLRNGFIHRDLDENSENEYRLRPLNNSFGSTTFTFVDKEVPGRIFNSTQGMMDSYVEMSTDHGANFIDLATINMYVALYAIATAPSNPNKIWFSFGSSAFLIDVTDPLAPAIGEITLPSLELLYGLVIDPADETRVLIGQGSEVYLTTNGGFTWEDSSTGLEDLVQGEDVIIKIDVNPFNTDEYVLASTQGIFLSSDAGLSWTQVFNEFVENIAFSSATDGHIVATNHHSDGFLFPQSSTRIIYSTDSGENWEVIPGEVLEFLNSGSSTYHFSEENADIYFGTFDTGLVKYTISLSHLGIESSAESNSTILSPNPASDYIDIISENNVVKDVTIYSITGQKLLQVSGKQQIDISGLSNGMHLVKIETDNEIYFKRLLKH